MPAASKQYIQKWFLHAVVDVIKKFNLKKLDPFKTNQMFQTNQFFVCAAVLS